VTLDLRSGLLLAAIALYILATFGVAWEGLNLHAAAGAVFASAFLA
jgi:hypothetical protein